jgi:hypothetical protein
MYYKGFPQRNRINRLNIDIKEGVCYGNGLIHLRRLRIHTMYHSLAGKLRKEMRRFPVQTPNTRREKEWPLSISSVCFRYLLWGGRGDGAVPGIKLRASCRLNNHTTTELYCFVPSISSKIQRPDKRDLQSPRTSQYVFSSLNPQWIGYCP